ITTPPLPLLYTLALHDALPISCVATWCTNLHIFSQAISKCCRIGFPFLANRNYRYLGNWNFNPLRFHNGFDSHAHCCRRSLSVRSEEHTTELQSRENLVCRLLL